MATKSKAKGNAFEIKLAKLLSIWFFNDPDILWRDSTSGGRKIIYNGDVIPAQVDKYPWKTWPFIIEAKHGYKEFIPTLMNQDKVRYWLNKLLSERTEKQFIPILIAKFHNSRMTMFITTMLLNAYCDICLKQYSTSDDQWYDFYIYDFDNILNEPFNEVLPSEIIEIL